MIEIFTKAMCELHESDFNEWINRKMCLVGGESVRYYEWAEDIVSDIVEHGKNVTGFAYIHSPRVLVNKFLNWIWAIHSEERRPFRSGGTADGGTNWVFPRPHSKHRNGLADYDLYHYHYDTEFALDFMNARQSYTFTPRVFNAVTALLFEFFYAYIDTEFSEAIRDADAALADVMAAEEATRTERAGWSGGRRDKDDPYLAENSRGGRQNYN